MSAIKFSQFMSISDRVKMCLRLRAVLACITIVTLGHHCNGMPVDQDDVDTSPYSYYYKVYDTDTNNYQGHVQRTADDGSTRGTYYHLAPDGVWYETTYFDNGAGFNSVSNRFTSAEQLSLNAFGPEPVRRADEGEIVIADGAAVIGGTMYAASDESDEGPVIDTRKGFGDSPTITEDDVRDSIFGGRPIVFGSGTGGGNRVPDTTMTFPANPPRTTGREIVFGGQPSDPSQDIAPAAPPVQPTQPEVSAPLDTNGSGFDSGFAAFDALFGASLPAGDQSLDGNRIPEGSTPTFGAPSLIPEPDIVEEPILSDRTQDIDTFDAGFDTLLG